MTQPATPKQRKRWDDVAALGCLATYKGLVCGGIAEIHHAETGMGGRKDHDKVIPLCNLHHTGKLGIHKSRRNWQPIYGYESDLLRTVKERLGEPV